MLKKKITSVSLFLTFFSITVSCCFGSELTNILKIENFLNSIETINTRFTQISDNGKIETGTLLIQKPGKMRFEYDPPSNNIVMSSGALLVIIDKKSTGEPQRYLTSQTPLGFLLDERIKLNNKPTLQKLFVKSENIYVVLYDQKNPKSGALELVFSQHPIMLREWTVSNYSEEKTRLLLEKLNINDPIDPKLFNIGYEISRARKALKSN